jgi:hypothetical protein
MPPSILDTAAPLADATRTALERDYARFGDAGLPDDPGAFVADEYGIDLGGSYGGSPIRCVFGKASGQLSLQKSQVVGDIAGGLGYVILKTVIAEDEGGGQSMAEWAIPETRMVVERITNPDGDDGWTVTWKGRGWYGTFEEYLAFFRESLEAARRTGVLIVPSCKYHLPSVEGEEWRVGEYAYTTSRLVEVWRDVVGDSPMPIEKDFSPTLAGDDRAQSSRRILDWLRRVPRLIREGGDGRVVVGLKLMNAMFDDAFQLDMIRAATEGDGTGNGADWLVVANRLFDPAKQFDGKTGVAYGGPELSKRNLRILRLAGEAERDGSLPPMPPISATGDILTGRMAAEYALAGAANFQMHTVFQLPNSEFSAGRLPRTARAVHRLVLHPIHGFVACMSRLKELSVNAGLETSGPYAVSDAGRLGSFSAL